MVRALIAMAAGVLAVAGMASTAEAASYTTGVGAGFAGDGTTNPREVPPFDTTLGTLQSITYELTVSFSQGLFIGGEPPPCGFPSSLTGYIEAGVDLGPASFNFGEDLTVPLQDPDYGFYNVDDIPFSSSGSISLADYDLQIEGGGALYLSAGGNFVSGDIDYSIGGPALIEADARVTYIYSTPEPAALAVLGMGVLGLAMARRRSLST